MTGSREKKIIELFLSGRNASPLRLELRKVAVRIEDVVADVLANLPEAEVQRIEHCIGDLRDVATFLRAVSSV